jgi:hypothetical protein
MNPYASLFSNPVDSAVAWLFTAGWTAVGAFLLRPCFASLQSRAERFCVAAAVALLGLSALIAAVLVIGLVFLVWLKLSSGFWSIWQLFYLLSVICIFRVLLVVAVVLPICTVLGHFGTRSLRLCAAVLMLVILDALLYVTIDANVA